MQVPFKRLRENFCSIRQATGFAARYPTSYRIYNAYFLYEMVISLLDLATSNSEEVF